jgi:hypothetical protein
MMTAEIDPNVGKEFIEHFGTKGMRWGVRKQRTDYGHGKGKKDEKDGKGKKDEKASSDSKPKTVVGKTKVDGKPVSQISDAQLKRINNRLQMEQQYAKLTDPGPSVTRRVLGSTGKFVTQAARNVAMTQVTTAANAEASKQIASLLAKRAGKLATAAA